MEAAFQDTPFFDFGEDALFPFARTGLHYVDGSTQDELRAQVRQFAPRQPGVYGMLDPLGRLVYVGKSKSLRNRLLSYFLPNNEEDKAGRIIQSTSSIVWETQPSEFAALLREQYLIRHFQPRFNVQGIPRRHQPIYICLGRAPAEQLYTSRTEELKAQFKIGPLFGSARANRAVEVLNRIFRLRDCSSKQSCGFTDQLQLFEIGMRPGCIRLEIQSCLGPCISACSRSEYERHVAQARQFLEGKNEQPVDQIRKQMDTAAANLHFEQATVLREDFKAVRWLQRRTADLASAREQYTFVYPVESAAMRPSSAAKQEVWYLIRRGVLEGAIAAPRTAAEAKRAHRRVHLWLEEDNCVGSHFFPRPETLALITSWFRNQRGELKKTFLPGISRAPAGRQHRPRAAVAVKA